MPPRTQEEKERRRILYQKNLSTRKAAKEAQEKELETQKSEKPSPSLPYTSRNGPTTSVVVAKLHVNGETAKVIRNDDTLPPSDFLSQLGDDAIRNILCFLPSRELGAMSFTCRSINYAMGENRVAHLLSRLKCNRKLGVVECPLLRTGIEFYKDEAEARALLQKSLGGGNTGRIVTKKSRKKKGDADEYIAYARFVEEGVSGYAIQNFGSRKTPVLPAVVNGRFASVSPEHSLCRIGGDGERCGAGGSGVASWGIGKRGQLGHGKRKDQSSPRRLMGGFGYGIRIVQVSAGGGLVRVAHSLLLTSTGRVLSFGTAQYGQLGHGYSAGKQLVDVLRPKYIDALQHVRCTCVSAGELHSAVVTTDGDLYTWGDGFCGQIGLGDKRPQLLPTQVKGGSLEDECVLSVSCGNRHTLCVTEDGEVYSFGLGHFGVLGRSYTPFEYDADAAIVDLREDGLRPPPMAMAPALNASAVVPPDSAIGVAALAINGGGEEGGHVMTEQTRAHLDLLANLTLDDNSDQCIPKVIDSLEGIKIVGCSSGHRHSIVLDENGGVFTFGSGAAGALGHGDYLRQDRPLRVMEFANTNVGIIQISAGVDISMAVSTKGDVYAWGKATGGRIGVGKTGDEILIPRRVIVNDRDGEQVQAVDVECGYVHSVIVGIDGTIHMCGGVGVDGDDDGQTQAELMDERAAGKPVQILDFNIWHRLPEPSETKSTTRWTKYGKYEPKGRSAIMSEAERWGV